MYTRRKNVESTQNVSEKIKTRRTSSTTDRGVALSETKIVFGKTHSEETVCAPHKQSAKKTAAKYCTREDGKK